MSTTPTCDSGGRFDLTGVPAGQAPTFKAKLSYDTEPGYDNVIVEAHTVGQDDWTTLPEQGGLTSTDVPAECEADFLLEEHAFLKHYLTPGTPCGATGTSGTWNAMTGSSDGWKDASFDLSAYAGKQVEVFVSYVTDPGFGRHRRVRRRHQAGRRWHAHAGRGLRERARGLGAARTAARKLAPDRQLRAFAEPVLAGDRDAGHGAARLRGGAARLCDGPGDTPAEGVRVCRRTVT